MIFTIELVHDDRDALLELAQRHDLEPVQAVRRLISSALNLLSGDDVAERVLLGEHDLRRFTVARKSDRARGVYKLTDLPMLLVYFDDQPVLHCQTLDDSKKVHDFTYLGDREFLLIRGHLIEEEGA